MCTVFIVYCNHQLFLRPVSAFTLQLQDGHGDAESWRGGVNEGQSQLQLERRGQLRRGRAINRVIERRRRGDDVTFRGPDAVRGLRWSTFL